MWKNKLLSRLIVLFDKRSLIFSFCIFICLFLIARLPYLLYAPIPSYGTDTFDYFWVAKYIIEGRSGSISEIIYDLPIGYPMFLSMCYFLNNTLTFVVLMHFLISLLSGVYIIYVFNKINPYLGFLIAFSISLYSIDGFTLTNDTSISTQSLYASFLIASIASYIHLFVSFTKRNLLIFSLLIIIPPLIRSEGIVIFSLIFFVFVQHWQKLKLIIRYVMVPFIIFNMGLSGYNLYSKGFFFPGNLSRIKIVFREDEKQKMAVNNPPKLLKKYPKTTFDERVVYYFDNFAHPYWHFYHHTLPSRYDRIIQNDINYYAFDFRLPVSEDLKKIAIKEFYKKDKIKSYTQFFENKNIKDKFLIKGYDIIISACNKLFFNKIILLVYFIISLIGVFLLFKKNTNIIIYIMNGINSIHLLNMLIISFTIPATYRVYIHTTEFIPLMIIVIAGYYFFNSLHSKKILNAQ